MLQSIFNALKHIDQTGNRVPTAPTMDILKAGNSEYLFDDMPADVIKFKDTPESRNTGFVIDVNGNSIEPDYCDVEKIFQRFRLHLTGNPFFMENADNRI